MKKVLLMVLLFVVMASLTLADWKPTRPITVIVPWSAGGSTDSVTRVTTAAMEPLLGTRFIIVNTPGGAGSIGTNNAWNAKHDGYTWTANAVLDMGKYAVLGYLNVTHRDWHYFLSIYTPNVLVVNPNTPYQTVEDFVKALKERPGEVKIASAGVGSGGHVAAEIFADYFGVSYKHIPYAGGNPATVAVVRGEAEANMQFSIEVADMLRAGKLRALCTLGAKPLYITGYGLIPTIRGWYPDFPDVASYFGLIIPRDVPQEVIETVTKVFDKAADSPSIKEYAETHGAVAVKIYGEEADKIVEEIARRVTWLLYDRGIAPISPEKFNIPRPEK